MFFPFFKYNSLISPPLFNFVFLVLLRRMPGFSLSGQTISKGILFLNKPTEKLIFRFNFILKALLDFGFVLFILDYFNLSWKAPVVWAITTTVLLFGSLAYLTEDKYSRLHKIVVYGSGLSWSFAELLLALITMNPFFIQMTIISVIVTLVIAFGFFLANRTNAIVQACCILIMYVWLFYFVFRFC